MIKNALLFCWIFLSYWIGLCPSSFAQMIDHESFEVGVEAFNLGNYEEALRIMKQYEKAQPTAAYIVQISSLMIKKKNQETAIYDELLDTLLRKGDVSVLDKLGFLSRFKGELNHLSGRRLLNSLSMQANRGDANAAFQLGLFFQEGTGVSRNFLTASNFFKIAAEKSHPEALNSFGFYKRFGIGVKKDEKEAESLFKQSVLLNNTFSFYNLSQLFYDKKDFLQAFILSDLGMQRINEDKEKKTFIRYKKLAKNSKKNISKFHQAYLEKFRPSWMAPLLKTHPIENISAPQRLPFPPKKMVEETDFMVYVTKDVYDNRYKNFSPLMPSWVSFDEETALNESVLEKKQLAPNPDEQKVIEALYYRSATPRFISLTLTRKNSAIPVMVGDVLTFYVHTSLHEDEHSQKGGSMYLKNTDYSISVENRSGYLKQDSFTPLLALSTKTLRQEAWISQTFQVQRQGDSIIRFVPQKTAENQEIFPYNIRIVAFPEPSEK